MKKLLFAFCLMFGAAVAVNAQETQDTTSTQSDQYNQQSEDATSEDATQDQDQDQDKMHQEDKDKDMQEISSSELPAAVQASLQGQDYSGWTTGQAYKKEKDGQTFYAVELTRGNETKKVKFDAQGNKIEKDKDKDKDDQ